MEENKVLAVVTEDEAEEFAELKIKEKAIQDTIDGLIEKRTEAYTKAKRLWEKIYKKYGVSGNDDLNLNAETREITLIKRT